MNNSSYFASKWSPKQAVDQQKEIARIYVELLQIKTKIEEQINDWLSYN